MAEEINGTMGGGSSGAAPAAAPAPTPAPAPSTSTSPSPSSGGEAASQSASAQTGQAQGSSDYMGVRDALAAYGVDLRTQFNDDHAALQHLALAYQQSRQNNELVQYGRQYMQHAGDFQAYLQQRQQQAAQQRQQQAAPQDWFKAPEFDPRWQHQITRDPTTGEMRAAPGAPPDVVQKYVAWAQHQSDFQQKMAQDPIGTLRPGLEQVVRQTAQQLIQEQLGAHQERQKATSFVADNSSWLHAKDAQGNTLRDQRTGMPALSELGQRFAGYVHRAEMLGLRDVESQQAHALALLQRDYAVAQLQNIQGGGQQGQQGQDANAQARANFLANAAANRPNAGGSVNAVAPNGQQPAQNTALSLKERLAQRFTENGYNLSTPVIGGR